MAVNKDVRMPIDSVMAKPLIGPVPNVKRTSEAIKVVTLASVIVAKAKGFLLVSSSPLTRSSYHADEDFAKLQQNRNNFH